MCDSCRQAVQRGAANGGLMTETELLTSRECAAWRRCSVRKLDRERAEGRGCPYVRIDGRVFYRRADVERFIEAHPPNVTVPTRKVKGLEVRSDGAYVVA